MTGGAWLDVCAANDRYWHSCDIARSRMDFRFLRKSGRAADIASMTEFDPDQSLRHCKIAGREAQPGSCGRAKTGAEGGRPTGLAGCISLEYWYQRRSGARTIHPGPGRL